MSQFLEEYVQKKTKKRGHLVWGFFVLNKKAFDEIKGDRKLALE